MLPKIKKQAIASVSEVCGCFGLKRDAYYKYLRRAKKKEQVVSRVIELVQNERKDQPRVGTRKLYEALSPAFMVEELNLGRDKLFDILREHDMLIKRKKNYCKTTDSHHRFHKYNNLIKDMEVSAPNQVWVSDITYIATKGGWLYLTVFLDLFSRMVVGWALSSSLSTQMVLTALYRGIRARRPGPGLIIHSDRGVQYACKEFRQVLEKHNFVQSMSRKGDCWDNAVAESFFGILKSELIHHERFKGPEDTLKAIFEYIEVYYNRKRKHSTLNYQTPVQYEHAVRSAVCF